MVLPTPTRRRSSSRSNPTRPRNNPDDIDTISGSSTSNMNLSPHHPRFLSLKTRDDLVKAVASGLIAPQGLIAQGRGEAFDYLIGERTMPTASVATLAAVALLLYAKSPVISVNGNTEALARKNI